MSVKKHTICTIITKNRLAWVRTLAESFLAQHPDGTCLALIIDEFEGYIDPAGERFEIVRFEDLELTDPHEFRFKYTAFELCCALKPDLLKHLLVERGFEKVFYLDSDIMVMSPLDDLSGALDDSDFVLTPHLDQDLPNDGKKPDDAHVMLSGVFNAGFIGVKNSAGGLQFLEWWRTKLENGCVEDHFNGYFVDQKYLDLVIGLFEGAGVIRDPGCNTAYWNLHSRAITKKADRWLANGKPLVFYHFSDYRLANPGEISGHQNRFRLEDFPDLKELFDIYRSRLIANGDENCRNWEYGSGKYRNNRKISPGTRRAYLLNDKYRSLDDPFDSSTHTMGLKLSSAWQGFLMLLKRVARRAFRYV